MLDEIEAELKEFRLECLAKENNLLKRKVEALEIKLKQLTPVLTPDQLPSMSHCLQNPLNPVFYGCPPSCF